MRVEILKKIETAISEVVAHHRFELTEETTAQDIDGWESITHMMIMSKVEQAFGIKFKLVDLMHMNNVGDLVSTIQKEIA